MVRYPIYLHFIDRELAGSVSSSADLCYLQKVIFLLLLGTPSPLYCSLATVLERFSHNQEIFAHVKELIQLNYLIPVNSHTSMSEFILTRKHLYRYDQERYPMYFKTSDSLIDIGRNITLKKESTTRTLITNLHEVKETQIENHFSTYDGYSSQAIYSDFKKWIEKIGDKAVTISSFKGNQYSTDAIGKIISEYYTKHYMTSLNADIATGLSYGLDYYSFLAKNQPFYDIKLLGKVFSDICPIPCKFFYNHVIDILQHKNSNSNYSEFLELVEKVVFTLSIIYNNNQHHKITRLLECGPIPPFNYDLWLVNSFAKLNKILNDKEVKPLWEGKISMAENKILICISTDDEQNEFDNFVKKNCFSAIPRHTPKISYYELGNWGQTAFYAIRTECGSGGGGGATLTVDNAIDELSPNAVIAVGIALGLRKEKQKMGDILVSNQVQAYELQRVEKNGIRYRGDKVSASPLLLQRLNMAKSTWKKATIHTGLILSGEKLVDSHEFITHLQTDFPDAIGGEMEAAGIVASCQRKSIPWIIIKAICDWGYDKTDNDHDLACKNVFDLFDFLMHSKALENLVP